MKVLPSIIALGLSAALMPTQIASAEERAGTKDPEFAFELSLGGTAASIGVMGLGVAAQNGSVFAIGLISTVVTPALGEWYAGNPLTWGMGLRVAGGSAFLGGAVLALKCIGDDSGECHSDGVAAAMLVFGGAGAYLGGIVYDIATAGTAAEDFNRKHDLSFAPTVFRGASNTTGVGLGIGGTF